MNREANERVLRQEKMHPGVLVWPVLVLFLATEITLTTRRLLYRTGLLSRASGEIPLDNIEGIFLLEPLLGRGRGRGVPPVTHGQDAHATHVFHATLQNAVNAAKAPARATGKPPAPPQDDSRYMPKG